MPDVLTIGTFDLLHPGHLTLLRRCRALAGDPKSPNAGVVTVAVNTDQFVDDFKGQAPVMSYGERCQMLRALTDVDYVIGNTHGPDARPTIAAHCQPGLLVIGSDWAGKDYYGQLGVTQEFLDEVGATVVYVHREMGDVSTTGIIRRVMVRESGRAIPTIRNAQQQTVTTTGGVL
jgi:glycerol-3-phosphate cytidylyltransferase